MVVCVGSPVRVSCRRQALSCSPIIWKSVWLSPNQVAADVQCFVEVVLGGVCSELGHLVTANTMLSLVPSIRYNRDPITIWYLLCSSGDATISDLIATYPAGEELPPFWNCAFHITQGQFSGRCTDPGRSCCCFWRSSSWGIWWFLQNPGTPTSS